MPTACAAIPIRPEVSVISACVNPVPSAPSIADAGTRTSSNARSTVFDVWIPSFSVVFSTTIPGRSDGTKNALIPFAPGPPVRNIAITTPA